MRFMNSKSSLRKNLAENNQSEKGQTWTFLTNHSHVLICISRHPEMVLRDIAQMVGITERAVQRIVADLVDSGYVKRKKEGRKNTYSLSLSKPLRHPVEKNCRIGDIVDLIK